MLTSQLLGLLPSLVVFDLDRTLITRPRFRRGPPFLPLDGGLSGVQASDGTTLDLFPAARRAVEALACADVPMAIVSRTHREAWAREWLATLRLNTGRTISETVLLVVIRDGSKREHVRTLRERTGIAYEEMLYFEDKLHDVRAIPLRTHQLSKLQTPVTWCGAPLHA